MLLLHLVHPHRRLGGEAGGELLAHRRHRARELRPPTGIQFYSRLFAGGEEEEESGRGGRDVATEVALQSVSMPLLSLALYCTNTPSHDAHERTNSKGSQTKLSTKHPIIPPPRVPPAPVS
eukprot:scaffold162212_cov36-Tisochrysis_lutea.AAC.1